MEVPTGVSMVVGFNDPKAPSLRGARRTCTSRAGIVSMNHPCGVDVAQTGSAGKCAVDRPELRRVLFPTTLPGVDANSVDLRGWLAQLWLTSKSAVSGRYRESVYSRSFLEPNAGSMDVKGSGDAPSTGALCPVRVGHSRALVKTRTQHSHHLRVPPLPREGWYRQNLLIPAFCRWRASSAPLRRENDLAPVRCRRIAEQKIPESHPHVPVRVRSGLVGPIPTIRVEYQLVRGPSRTRWQRPSLSCRPRSL